MYKCLHSVGFHGGSEVKNAPTMQETQVPALGWKDPLEKEMASHSSIHAWKIPRSLAGYSPWSHIKVRDDLATKQTFHTQKVSAYQMISIRHSSTVIIA